ncbi:MAG: aldo/keto reductase [Planctomycetes bacterium]|nr:aldo/keto reductase [Planctomycetota bacterium]
MNYRTLGRTGLRVSALGFGAMRLPMTDDEQQVDRKLALPMFRRAFEGGVNYVDSAVGYCNQDSQRTVGEALAEWFADGHPRDSIVVSTKNPHYDKADRDKWWKNLEDSLERLKVDYIDCYHHHFLQWKSFDEHVQGPGGHYEQMLKAKEQGLIRHIGFSFHDTPENFIKIIDSGLFEFTTCQYNLLDRKNEAAIAHARKKGMGVIIMGPVAGGRLSVTAGPMGERLPEGVATTPELALRFVLANPNVSVALSGMTRMSDVEENLRTAARGEPLSAAEKKATEDALESLKSLADLYCTGCRYCEPECPQQIRIADIFHHMIVRNVYGGEEAAVRGYAFMKRAVESSGKKMADACIECGKCEKACPQNIPIRQQLKEARAVLDKS